MVTGVFSENLILYRIPTSSPVSVHRSQSTELQRTGWLRAYKVHIAKVHIARYIYHIAATKVLIVIARYSVRGTKYTSRHTRIGYTGLPASTPH